MNDQTIASNRKYFKSDAAFNELYTDTIKMLAERYWTPLHIAKSSVSFLADNGCKILDIGSGVGKFCLIGAKYAPTTQFYGIEQRSNLVEHALEAQNKLGLTNVSFIDGNVIQLNLQDYDHFYFFNSFYENKQGVARIDDEIEYSETLYNYYVDFLYRSLQKMRAGTKLVTYHSLREVPIGYELIESLEYGDLNFWMKK